MNASRLRFKRGFTLTEILVVCGIISVLGGAAVMNVVGRAPYYRLDHARLQLISDLRGARQLAVTVGTRVSVTFADSSKTYTIWADHNSNGAVDTGEETTKTLPSYTGLTMVSSPASGYFSSMGNWSTTAASVTLTLSPAGTQTIYITPSGEVDSDA